MDKELIAMCDCPEIQDGWSPQIRDLVKTDNGLGYVTHIGDPKAGGELGSYRVEYSNESDWDWEWITKEGIGNNKDTQVHPIFLPSVSWLLREIEVGQAGFVNVTRDRGGYYSVSIDYDRASGKDYHSPICDSPEKALVHVFMWQKGKVWKDGKWVNS